MSVTIHQRALMLGILTFGVLVAIMLLAVPKASGVDFDLHLVDSDRFLSPEAPEGDDDEQWTLDPVAEQQVGNYSIYLGSQLRISGPVDFIMHVETSDVHSITFELDYFYWTLKDGYTPLGSTITGTEEGSSIPGPDYYMNGNYTVEADSSQTLGTHTIPGGATLWCNISVQIDWRQADPAGNSGTFFWGAEERDSKLMHQGRMVFFDDENTVVINERRDFDPDTLYMAINLTDAFGVGEFATDFNDLNYSSASISIDGMDGQETIKSLTVEATEYSNLTFSAVWHYQEDEIGAAEYRIEFVIMDIRDQSWEVFTDFYVEVDFYAVEVELVEGDPKAKVGRGKTASYRVQVTNVGNSVDTVWFEKDATDLPGGWDSTIANFGPHVLYPGNSSVASFTVKVAEDANSGSFGNLVVRAYTNHYVDDQLTIKTQVQRYGVDVSLVNGKTLVEFNFLSVNPETGIELDFKVKNTGDGSDTFTLEGTTDRGWDVFFYRGDDQRSSVSLDAKRHEILVARIIPLTSSLKNGDETLVSLVAYSEADASKREEQELILLANVPLDEVVDLQVLPDTLDLDPEEPVEGEKVILKLTIFNGGGQTAANFQVQLAKAANNQILYDEFVAQLGPSESLEVEFEWKNPTEGTTGIIFRVDSLLKYEEPDEDNNEFLYNLAVAEAPPPASGDDDDGFLPALPASMVLVCLLLVSLLLRRRH